MNRDHTQDSRPTNEEPTPAGGPVRVESTVPLHRLGEARRKKHVSRSSLASQLGITAGDVRRQECKTTDMPLSVLHQWAKVLGVPVVELVEEPNVSLSTPLFHRAALTRFMETVMAILERSNDLQTQRLAQTLVDQLIEILPEARGVIASRTAGEHYRFDGPGSAVERGLSHEIFMDVVDSEELQGP